MYESVVFMFFYIFLMIVILGVLIPMYVKHAKATGGVVNYNTRFDGTMTKFVYKVYMSREEIINSLKIMNVKDELSCTFDFEKNIIIFTDLSYLNPTIKLECFYEIQECDGFSILKLSLVSPLFHERTNIPFKLNPFMVSKINAEIVPFSQYGK